MYLFIAFNGLISLSLSLSIQTVRSGLGQHDGTAGSHGGPVGAPAGGACHLAPRLCLRPSSHCGWCCSLLTARDPEHPTAGHHTGRRG